MMLLVRIVAFLHLAVYIAIIVYGWRSYAMLRKPSWKVMGIGFIILLLYRTRQFVRQMIVDYPIDTETTLIPFIASVLLLVAFRMLYTEHKHLLSLMAEPPSPLRAGAQSVEYWIKESRKTLDEIRKIVREEIAAARTTVTVTGPSEIVPQPPEEKT